MIDVGDEEQRSASIPAADPGRLAAQPKPDRNRRHPAHRIAHGQACAHTLDQSHRLFYS